MQWNKVLDGQTADWHHRPLSQCDFSYWVWHLCRASRSCFKDIYSAKMAKWIDGHIKVRAENRLLSLLYSCACTRVPASVMRPDGRSCLQTGNAIVSNADRQQKQRESQIDRQRDVGGKGWVCFAYLSHILSSENKRWYVIIVPLLFSPRAIHEDDTSVCTRNKCKGHFDKYTFLAWRPGNKHTNSFG